MRKLWCVAVLAGLLALLQAAPAQATKTFPGTNGALVSSASGCVVLIAPDGSGRTQPGACSAWGAQDISPDGQRLMLGWSNADDTQEGFQVVNLDGTNPVVFPFPVDFYPDYRDARFSGDARSVYVWYSAYYEACCGYFYDSYLKAADGSGSESHIFQAYNSPMPSLSDDNRTALAVDDRVTVRWPYQVVYQQGSGVVHHADWSPLEQRILFDSFISGTGYRVAVINVDGTGLQFLTTGTAVATQAITWSPDGQEVLYQQGSDVHTIGADGTGDANIGPGQNPVWSPDSQKVAFQSNRDGIWDLYVVNRDGSSLTRVTNDSVQEPLVAWQPILKGYPRPKGAGTLHAPLVPAYTPCTSPNRVHAAPLSYNSCNPPSRYSTQLALGTPDANGKAANSNSSIRIGVVPGNPATPADEAEARFTTTITDVRNADDLTDYTGNLEARIPFQITDRSNTPYPGGPGPGTVQQFTLPYSVPCSATADTTVGANCSLFTTADTLFPGSVIEGRRAIWETDRIEVRDGSGQPFLRQGIFIP